MFPMVCLHNAWQMREVQFLADAVRSSGHHVLVDVGANAGLVSRQLICTVAAGITAVHCFEPDADN